MKHLGISLANQGSYILTFLMGEAKSRVEEELASVCSPTKEQVLEILMCYYGNPSKIMQHLIDTHKSLGKIPSQEEGWKSMYPIVNEHYKVINSMRELASEVGGQSTPVPIHRSLGGCSLPLSSTTCTLMATQQRTSLSWKWFTGS